MRIQSAIITTCLFMILMILISNCTGKGPIPDVPEKANVTFKNDIKPVTSETCSGCHKAPKDWSNYEAAYAYRHQIYNKVVLEKTMPVGKQMSDETRALFRDWVKQGGKE